MADDFRKIEAMLARMDLWAENLADGFVWQPVREDKDFAHEKIPAVRTFVTPPFATDEIYRRCAQSILKAAHNLVHVKPRGLETVRTTAIVGYPDMFRSEVCVFFDPDYWSAFTRRDSDDDRWIPIPESSLARRLGLQVPDGFVERGWRTHWRDDSFDPPYEDEGETWIYHERLAGE